VWNVNLRGDRSLLLRHTQHRGQPLDSKGAQEVLKHVARLWGFGVHLESASGEDITQRWSVAGPV
jgi:stage V sporulation protein R